MRSRVRRCGRSALCSGGRIAHHRPLTKPDPWRCASGRSGGVATRYSGAAMTRTLMGAGALATSGFWYSLTWYLPTGSGGVLPSMQGGRALAGNRSFTTATRIAGSQWQFVGRSPDRDGERGGTLRPSNQWHVRLAAECNRERRMTCGDGHGASSAVEHTQLGLNDRPRDDLLRGQRQPRGDCRLLVFGTCLRGSTRHHDHEERSQYGAGQ